MKIRENILKLIDKSSDSVAKLPDYKRVRLELIIYAYMAFAFLTLIIVGAFVNNTLQTILYSIGIAVAILQFINKSTIYRKLKFLSQFQNGKA
ncbi:MAG: hypothetical protein ACOC56_06605 [Atribacterota bacterium]